MKIDFYSPKNYYGSHIASWSGWLSLLGFLIVFPLNNQVCGKYGIFYAFFIIPFFAISLLLPMPFYALEWLFASKVKNQFLLKNKAYDFFFDLGCVFCFLPIVWFFEMCKFRILPFTVLIAIFLTVRLLKFAQDRVLRP